MSTCELNESQPVLGFLAPAGADGSTPNEPTQSPFYHPSPGRVLNFTWNRTRVLGFIPPAAVFDMRHVALLLDEQVDIPTIIRFVGTEVLGGRRTFDQDRQDQSRDVPLVVFIGAGDMNGQGSASLVDQNVDLASEFSSISRILAGIFATQGGWTVATIHSLPDPTDMARSSVVPEHRGQDLLEDPLPAPGLESLMDDATGYTEPLPLYGLPLATGPQHKPDAIQRRTVAGTRPTRTRLFVLWQVLLNLPPKLAWNSAMANIFRLLRFCGTLTHGVSPLQMGFETSHL